MNKEVSVKYDTGKPRLAEMFISFAEPLTEMCKVWEFGATKYGVGNWQGLENGKNRYLSALCRHLLKSEGEKYDPETGFTHLTHCCFNALAALYFEMKEDGRCSTQK